MKYKEYIDLGFERIDLGDSVHFNRTGYYGFILTKKVNKKISIEVSDLNLDNPFMYIAKRNNPTFHTKIQITPEQVKDLLHKPVKHEIHLA